MVTIQEIPIAAIDGFWNEHIKYLVEDGIIDDEEDIAYFASEEYRGIIKSHMERAVDKHKLVYFMENGQKVGACSYCIYGSEDGKCFILDFWVFPQFRGGGMGHRCFAELQKLTRKDGAIYYEINSSKEDSIRFWKSVGFVENGIDEYGEKLFVRR